MDRSLPAAALMLGGFHPNVTPTAPAAIEQIRTTVVDRWCEQKQGWRHFLLRWNDATKRFDDVIGEVDSLGLLLPRKAV